MKLIIDIKNPNEMEFVQELLHKLQISFVLEGLHEKREKPLNAEKTIALLQGKGKGVWEIDAQDYVNQLRENDR